MGIKIYKKQKEFKTKNGSIMRSFGFIEGPLMQMSKMYPHAFDLLTNENKKADVIDVETSARRPRDNEFIFDHRELDVENSPFENMCKYIEANSSLKIKQITEDELYVSDAYGFRISQDQD